jgi:Tol biopolymer transport system component
VISQPPYPSFITLPVDPGVVLKTNDATDLTAESAKVSGEIERPANPEPAADTNCRFEYVTDAQFDADGFQDASQTPCDIDSLMGPGERKAVEAELTDLKSGTEYHLRLTATNAGPDASLEATNSFTTVAVPVTASQTPGASDREAGYVLAGLVNPRNSTVSECKFVYGPNSEADYKKYPFAVDCSQMPASVARPVTVEGHVTGLTPDATYHSRLVVTNGFSTVVTPDQSFVPTRDAAQNCPNEQLRKENSSLALPECRAYELITPMGKEGFGARFFRVAATNSDAVAYISEAGNLFRSGTNNVFGSGSGSFYVAVRKATGWETIPDLNGASGSIRDAPSLVTTSTAGGSYSEDLLTSIWRVHRLDGLPGENFYLRNQDGSFTPIGPNNGYEGVGTFETGAYSADLTHVVRWSGGGVPAIWGPGVYETVGTKNAGAPRRLDVDNAGAPISTCLEDGGASAVGDAVSRDGRVVVFTASGGCGGANPPADEIWARVGGAASIDVSGTRCARIVPACNAPSPPKFISMSSDGSRVIITTAQQLVDTDTDDSDDIYACDIPSGSLTPSTERPNPCAALRRVSVPETGAAEVEGVEATSADGSTVLFTARGVLAANKDAIGRTAVGGDHNLYVWHLARGDQEGRISFLGHLASDDVSGQAADSPQVTSDGRYVIFSTASQLVNTDTDNARDVYRYDVGTAGLLRVSTNTLGVGGNAEGFDARGEGISEDGTKVIFQTSEPLSPADINAAPDLYLWTPTRVYLITTGAPGGGAAGLAAIDRSGENIFFHTTAELTRADGDELSDVYTARIGGGFSFDEPPSCSGEACRPPLVDPSTGPPAATSRPRPDGGNVKHKTCRKGKKLKLRKCVRKKGKNHPRRPHPVRGS